VTNNLLDLSLEPIPSDALSTQQIIDIGMKKCIQDNTTEFTTYQETNRSEQQIVNGKHNYKLMRGCHIHICCLHVTNMQHKKFTFSRTNIVCCWQKKNLSELINHQI